MDGSNMTLSEYIAVEELKHQHRDGWGSTTALWVIAAIILVVAIVYNWVKSCNEKVRFATGLSDLNGRVNCLAPQVDTLNKQMYGAAQAFAGLTVGVDDLKNRTSAQLDALNNTVFWNPVNQGYFRGNNGCGCNRGCSPSRVFAQTQTYKPGDSQVTVTETCGNDRC